MTRQSGVRPSCYLIAASLLPAEFPGVELVKRAARLANAKKGTLRVVVFDSEPPVYGIAIFPSKQNRPTETQLQRMYVNAFPLPVDLALIPITEQRHEPQ